MNDIIIENLNKQVKILSHALNVYKKLCDDQSDKLSKNSEMMSEYKDTLMRRDSINDKQKEIIENLEAKIISLNATIKTLKSQIKKQNKTIEEQRKIHLN